jgi:DMSO/TMAO reductase YedYZ molybdopterin-dependent catalytic subunit
MLPPFCKAKSSQIIPGRQNKKPSIGEEKMKHNRITLLVLSIITLLALLVSACGPAATPTPMTPTKVPPTAVPPTAVPPTKVAPTLEPVTLTVIGEVNNELQLTESDLRAMNVVTLTLEHPKNGPTEYTGVRLNEILDQAGIKEGAGVITLTANDGYTYDLDLAAVQACADCLVAFDSETPGVYNAAMAGQSSKAWVKGLVSIVVAAPEPVTLVVTGTVDTALQLTDSALHAMNVVTLTLDHPKKGATEYTGVRLNDILNQAGIQDGSAIVTFTASDGFTNELDLATVQACADCLVAFDPTIPGVYNLAMPGQTSGKAWINGLVLITVAAPEPVTLVVTGTVDTELQLTDSALHAMDVVTLTLEHPKKGATDYTGVRLNDLLTQAGIQEGATTVTFTASDGFTNELDLATVQACADCLVAFDPTTAGIYNLAMPGQTSGKAWINGLVTITVK